MQIRPRVRRAASTLTPAFPDGAVAAGRDRRSARDGDGLLRPVGDGQARRRSMVRGAFALGRRPLRLVQLRARRRGRPGRGHVSLVSEASLAELGRHAGARGPVDGRRFRMLFELEGCRAARGGRWIKRHLRIGEALVTSRGDVGRCAITTQNPETGMPDFDTLRTISGYRGFTRTKPGAAHPVRRLRRGRRAGTGDNRRPRRGRASSALLTNCASFGMAAVNQLRRGRGDVEPVDPRGTRRASA